MALCQEVGFFGNPCPHTGVTSPAHRLLTDPDRALVEACQRASGEEFEEAFRQLFDLYQDRVYTICLRVTGNSEDALDAAQETMLTLVRRIGDFAFRSRFSSWVYRIAVNSAIDSRRRRTDAKRGQVSTSVGNAEGQRAMDEAVTEGENADPVESAVRTENQIMVQEALANLNPRFASLLTLRYVQGLSYEEIAEVQEVSLGTVKSRLNRAHTALREYLAARGQGTSPESPLQP